MPRLRLALVALLAVAACDESDDDMGCSELGSQCMGPVVPAPADEPEPEDTPSGPAMSDAYEGTAVGMFADEGITGTVTIVKAGGSTIDFVIRIETPDCVIFGAKDDVAVGSDGTFGPTSLSSGDGACDFQVRVDGHVSPDAADGSWTLVGPAAGGEWEADAT